MSDDFDDTGLEIGELAVGLTLKDAGGAEFDLSGLLAKKPVVMVFGSFT
jgi:peroxiredoxin